MTALLAAEIRRMTSRRLFRVVAALAVLAIVIASLIVALRSRSTSGIAGDRRFHLTALAVALEGTSPVLIIAAWLLGASFIGADWHAGKKGREVVAKPGANRERRREDTARNAADGRESGCDEFQGPEGPGH